MKSQQHVVPSPFHIGQRIFDITGIFVGVVEQVCYSPLAREHEGVCDTGYWYCSDDLRMNQCTVGRRFRGREVHWPPLSPNEIYRDYNNWELGVS